MGFRRAIRISGIVVTTMALLSTMTGCGLGSSDDPAENVTWHPATVVATAADPAPAATPPLAPPGAVLTPDQLRDHRPNGLGWVPVIEYHVITTDESTEADPFVRTADHLREDLQWLYDHGFYVITTREFIENRIAAPVGKRPVILSFDDGHFS